MCDCVKKHPCPIHVLIEEFVGKLHKVFKRHPFMTDLCIKAAMLRDTFGGPILKGILLFSFGCLNKLRPKVTE